MLLTGSKAPATLGFYPNAGFQTTKTGFDANHQAVAHHQTNPPGQMERTPH